MENAENSDISKEELIALIEEIPQLIEAAKEELACTSDCPCVGMGCRHD